MAAEKGPSEARGAAEHAEHAEPNPPAEVSVTEDPRAEEARRGSKRCDEVLLGSAWMQRLMHIQQDVPTFPRPCLFNV